MRLLIVDESAQDRTRTVRLLEDAFGAVIAVTADSPEAYGQALTADPVDFVVDFVLTEHALSWSDGFTVLREVQEHWPHVPVIMVTGSGSETLAVDALRAGLADYVPKAHLERLVPALEHATEHVKTSEALRESEEKVRLLVTHIPDTLFFQDRDLRYTWIFNPSAPLTVDEVIGKTDADMLPAQEAERLTAIKRRVLATGESIRVEVQLSPGGITRWYEAFYEPSRDAAGRIVGVVSYSRDITASKQAEEDLRRYAEELEVEQARLSTFVVELAQANLEVESLARFPAENPYPVLRVNEDGTVIYANEASRPILTAWGCDVGQPVPAFWQGIIEQALAQDEPVSLDIKVDAQTFAFVAAPIMSGGYVNLYGRDITERKRAEDALLRYTSELETLNETNRTLLQEINHRVKNNLTAILGLIFAEQRRLDEEAAGNGGMPRCQTALSGLGERVRSLATAHTLLSASGWRPLWVDELVGEVVKASIHLTGDSESVVVDITGTPVRVTPEQAHHLALVIGELTTNTAKYGRTAEGVRISVNVTLSNGDIRIVYRTGGPGYPERVISGEGHSVGLRLVRTIVTHSLRGTWSIRNEEGPVTEIRFPADREANEGRSDEMTG